MEVTATQNFRGCVSFLFLLTRYGVLIVLGAAVHTIMGSFCVAPSRMPDRYILLHSYYIQVLTLVRLE